MRETCGQHASAVRIDRRFKRVTFYLVSQRPRDRRALLLTSSPKITSVSLRVSGFPSLTRPASAAEKRNIPLREGRVPIRSAGSVRPSTE